VKKAPLILMALNGLVWGGLSWMGWGAMKDVLAQHVVGAPNSGQIGYYLVFPLVMLTVSLLPGALLGQTRWSAVANGWCSLTLVAVFPYLLPYTGGI
jgi:hypothetical protein